MSIHPIFQALGLDVPIFQAPIGGIASAELAAAVAKAGGLGHLACTWRSHEQLDQLVAIKFVRSEALSASDAAERFLREGRRVRIATPPVPGTDFNDVLRTDLRHFDKEARCA